MINVTVINIKSVFKYFSILMVLISLFFIFKFASKRINFSSAKINVSMVGSIKETLPKIAEDDKTEKLYEEATSSRGSGLKRMLIAELPMMNNLIIDGEENDDIYDTESSINDNIEEAKTDVTTEEIQENNITPKYNCIFGTVKVKNESDREITEETLTPNISLENNKDIIIFHTHTCESYTPSEQFSYEMTGSYRTTDLNYTVARVGTELEKYLTNYSYNVVHDKTYHDYPAYSGSYGRSLETVKSMLQNIDAQLVIDLHRDAVRKQCRLCSKCKNWR